MYFCSDKLFRHLNIIRLPKGCECGVNVVINNYITHTTTGLLTKLIIIVIIMITNK